jgi:hypothetical protein
VSSVLRASFASSRTVSLVGSLSCLSWLAGVSSRTDCPELGLVLRGGVVSMELLGVAAFVVPLLPCRVPYVPCCACAYGSVSKAFLMLAADFVPELILSVGLPIECRELGTGTDSLSYYWFLATGVALWVVVVVVVVGSVPQCFSSYIRC